MKIDLSSITHLMEQGYLSLQVPELYIGCAPDPKNLVDVPDEYFIRNNYDKPAVGRESGFLYLSRKGYEHFKPTIKSKWSTMRGHTWKEFEDYAETLLKNMLKSARDRLVIITAEYKVKPTPYNKQRVKEIKAAIFALRK